MQHLEVSCAVRRLYKYLGAKGLTLREVQGAEKDICLREEVTGRLKIFFYQRAY